MNQRLVCPNCQVSTPITAIRGDDPGAAHGLRSWNYDDVVPKPDDVFQERPYCVRWSVPALDQLLMAERGLGDSPVPVWVDLGMAIDRLGSLLSRDGRRELGRLRAGAWTKDKVDRARKLSRTQPKRLFRGVTDGDREREARVLALLQARFAEWQDEGWLPSRRIERGDKTDELIRTRGWTHWHQLTGPRQLLLYGALRRAASKSPRAGTIAATVACMLSLGRCLDYNTRLCGWAPSLSKVVRVFSNQALNTLYNYPARGLVSLRNLWIWKSKTKTAIDSPTIVSATDARDIGVFADIWVTDPPYADAVNYHELSEYFLAWYERGIRQLFPDWSADSKRALAIQGRGHAFREAMRESYTQLVAHMPDNGLQVVMFTHKDASVWADVTRILWAAGLQVTAAWTIATETDSALKVGNYVQGTVLMVLRKRTSRDRAFLDEVTQEIEAEVRRQVQSMRELDDQEEPNFADADYQLGAYAATLRVLTRYEAIEEIDLERELRGEGTPDPDGTIERTIRNAVQFASNLLIPRGFDSDHWRRLVPHERFYIKALEAESSGEYRAGVYQEYARGFGVHDYTTLLSSRAANRTRVKTASEFRQTDLNGSPFSCTLLRQALYGVWQTAGNDNDTQGAMRWLRDEIPGDYWDQRKTLVAILKYLASMRAERWETDASAARILAGAVENDRA